MDLTLYAPSLEKMRLYYETGVTRRYSFRLEQLKKLKAAILHHEHDIYNALYADLKKSPEETWVTEIGIVIAEINTAIRNLRSWMAPQHTATNLVNLPSRSKIIREPLGVVLIIGPWNYPFQLLLNPFLGAIAAGNCVVLKPSEFAPATAMIMQTIIEKIFPKEYTWFVPGDGATVIPSMMNNFRFDHVFFTGSTTVGRIIYKMAAENLVPVTLELGGKSPCIVEADANIRVAARRIAMTKFSNAGQMCIAPDYVLVHESKKQELLLALKQCIVQFFGEQPEESYNYCRIINQKQFDRVSGYLSGANIFHGGRTNRDLLFIEPTILTDVNTDATVMKEEIFGPVLPVLTFGNADEAISVIAKNPNPLSMYVFTSNSKKERTWMESISFGGGCVNNASWHFTNHHLPFGGRGSSGIGNFHGRYSFETFSHKKSIMKTPGWFDPAIKYPPFKGKLKLFRWIIR